MFTRRVLWLDVFCKALVAWCVQDACTLQKVLIEKKREMDRVSHRVLVTECMVTVMCVSSLYFILTTISTQFSTLFIFVGTGLVWLHVVDHLTTNSFLYCFVP